MISRGISGYVEGVMTSKPLSFSRRLRAAASVFAGAALAVAGTLAGQAVAQAAPAATVTQGQMIMTAEGSTCTVGYVEADRAWTAAHCGLSGQQMYAEDGTHLGTLRWLKPSGAAGQDIAYIQFAAGTVSGGNPKTGDGINPVPPTGTQICVDGRRTGNDCAATVDRLRGADPGMNFADPLPKLNGDSGSGVKVPGQSGVVGIYQGATYLSSGQAHRELSNYARMPDAGELASLRHQGYVPRKANLPRTVTPIELPGLQVRELQEQAEGLVTTSSEGPGWDSVRGIALNYGVVL